jgi:hypothetical protein
MNDAQQYADTAAEAVRQINHETMSTGEGWQYPSDAYSVVASLAHMARMLPQAIEQSGALVHRAAADGRLTHDNGADPERYMEIFKACEGDAKAAADMLAAMLDTLHAALSPLGYRVDDEQEEQ